MVVRKGTQSTEFFALILMAAVVVANGTEWVNIASDQLNMLLGVVGAYIAQRGYVKGKAADAGGKDG